MEELQGRSGLAESAVGVGEEWAAGLENDERAPRAHRVLADKIAQLHPGLQHSGRSSDVYVNAGCPSFPALTVL